MINITRTLVLTFVILVILVIHQGIVSPRIAAIAGSSTAQVDDTRPLRMTPLVKVDQSTIDFIRNNPELAHQAMRSLADTARGDSPVLRLDGSNIDNDFALDGNSIEVLDQGEKDSGAIEVPESLFYEDYSSDAYVDNVAPSTPESVSATDEEKLVEEDGKNDEATALKLQGIIVGEQGRLALINGEVWAEGDWLGEYQLSQIQATRVLFRAVDGSIFSVGM